MVEIGGRAVGARVFVAEAGRDLEVFVKARNHQQLFELLWRLRQRVELARMQTRRHEEVARSFGGGCGDDRGLELTEVLIPHTLADRGHNVRAQCHVLLHLLTTQVEVAVTQARFLRVLLIAKHLQRQLSSRAKHLDVACVDFDLARWQLRIDQALIPCFYGAIDAHTPLGAYLFHFGKGRAVGIADHLGDPIMVPQIKEEHPAVIPHPVYPAGQAHIVTLVLKAQIGTGVAAIGVHDGPFLGLIQVSRRYTV
ncbi:hypothetical protein XMM354_003342 [Aliiroseovarius sp. xm-m-354]|nr:hypothetical protein [Aliiroseovarius sp. xm-m-354]